MPKRGHKSNPPPGRSPSNQQKSSHKKAQKHKRKVQTCRQKGRRIYFAATFHSGDSPRQHNYLRGVFTDTTFVYGDTPTMLNALIRKEYCVLFATVPSM